MRLEEISKYGQPLTFPKEVQRKQLGIVLNAMREEFGLLGLVPFLVRVVVEQRRLKKAHPDLVAEASRIGPEVATEMLPLTALFNVTARRTGCARAYEFLKRIFQRVAVHSMPAIYSVDELVQCEGDVFENFKSSTTSATSTSIGRERHRPPSTSTSRPRSQAGLSRSACPAAP